MSLFELNIKQADYPINILPFDGETLYFGKVFNKNETSIYFDKLISEIKWENDEVIIFGKHLITSRKVAWYGDREYEYKYSNITKRAKIFNRILIELKSKVEEITNATYNSCLLNLYHNGNEGMSWHTDNETYLKPNGSIASLSFGVDRFFSFKHKNTKQTIKILLENGSLLLMKGQTQTNWLHSLPKSKLITNPRINLTFRTIIR